MTTWVIPQTGIVIGACCKCASTSLANTWFIPWTKPLTDSAVIELRACGWRVIGVLRDPVERLTSAYNFFKYGQCGVYPPFGEPKTIREFVLAVLSGKRDPHWNLQTEQLNADLYCDLEVVPLAAKDNQNPHQEIIPPDLIKDVMAMYAADYTKRGNIWPL